MQVHPVSHALEQVEEAGAQAAVLVADPDVDAVAVRSVAVAPSADLPVLQRYRGFDAPVLEVRPRRALRGLPESGQGLRERVLDRRGVAGADLVADRALVDGRVAGL